MFGTSQRCYRAGVLVGGGLQEPTQQKLKHLCRRQLLDWAKTESLIYLDELTTANLTNFRNGWSDAALSKKKKHERLIGFFSFCVGCSWIQKNPASVMGRVKSNPVPTDYFPREEFEKIVDSTYVYQEKGYAECRNHATRLRTMVLLMRWSGLRISDAITLERTRLIAYCKQPAAVSNEDGDPGTHSFSRCISPSRD